MGRTRTRNPTVYSNEIGSTRGNGGINRPYNFINARDGGLGPAPFWLNYFSAFRPGPPGPSPPIYSDKIIALLDFSYSVDIRVKNTLEYYFDNVSEFTRFKILNTGGTVDGTISLLNEYYSKGFRYFIGFNQTALLPEGILQWFNDHPDVTPISTDSSSESLSFQKSLYRMTPVSSVLLQLYSTIIAGTKDILYFIYDSTLPQNQLLVYYLQQVSQQTGKTVVFKPIDGESNITIDNINTIMSSIPSEQNAVITVSMLTGTDKFYNTFNSTTTTSPYSFYELSVVPNITSTQAQSYFNTILFVPDIANISSSPLWRQGYNSLGQINYDSKTLNAMIMCYTLVLNKYIDQLGSFDNTLIFNPVTRDNQSASVTYSLYVNNLYLPVIIGFQDSNSDIYIAQKPI